MVAIINWAQVDQKLLADTMANTLSELDAIAVIIYSPDGVLVNAQKTGITDQNKEINIMKDLFEAGDTREIIKNIEIGARNYVVHGINLTIGNLLGLIYNSGTPYRTIRKQSGYFLEMLKLPSQSEGKASNLAAQQGNELIPGIDLSENKSPEEQKSSSNVSICTKNQTATPAGDAEKTTPATVPNTKNWDQYYPAGWT